MQEGLPMTSHGGGVSRLGLRAVGAPVGTCPYAQAAFGFRHFLGEPKERCRLGAQRPDASDADQAQERQLLKKLAMALQFGHRWDGGTQNPNIPSGYTYLLQLTAHDIVQSSL